MSEKNVIKDIENVLRELIKTRDNGYSVNLTTYANQIIELQKPSKVKLPKAAYEWMEKHKNLGPAGFEHDFINLMVEYESKNKMTIEMLGYLNDAGSIFKLMDAYRYGYELKETEEERIKRNIRETLHNGAGVMIPNEIVDKLYNIAKGKDNLAVGDKS